jgi:hypothetical protein
MDKNTLNKGATYVLSSRNFKGLKDALRKINCYSNIFTVIEIKKYLNGNREYILINNGNKDNKFHYSTENDFISDRFRIVVNFVSLAEFKAKFYEYNPDDDIPIE